MHYHACITLLLHSDKTVTESNLIYSSNGSRHFKTQLIPFPTPPSSPELCLRITRSSDYFCGEEWMLNHCSKVQPSRKDSIHESIAIEVQTNENKHTNYSVSQVTEQQNIPLQSANQPTDRGRGSVVRASKFKPEDPGFRVRGTFSFLFHRVNSCADPPPPPPTLPSCVRHAPNFVRTLKIPYPSVVTA